MTTTNPAAHLRGILEFTYKNIVNDLNALTEAQSTATPSETVRSAIRMVAECAGLNAKIAAFLASGEPLTRSTPEEREAYFAKFTTRADALQELETTTQALFSAIDTFDAGKWDDPVTGIFGQPSTCFATAEFPAFHMMYHDGQLNYLHMLHGDTEMHW